jgi:hypothetical protein
LLEFQQIPRANNKAADAMATIASLVSIPDNQDRYEFLVENLTVPAYDQLESEMVCTIVSSESPWYHEILAYLRNKIIPLTLTPNQRKTFIRRTSRYTILGDTLYRRNFDGTLLRCLDSEEAKTALEEVHQGICGAHSSGLTLAKKLLRTGYYWPTMEEDAYHFVKRCVPCQ